MTSPRLLNLETIEDRLVPAVISVSYLGSAFVLQTTSQGDHGRASTPTVTRAEVFRVINDDGSVQYLLRSANWSGNWNQYLVPSRTPTPAAARSTVEVPYSPNYRPDRSESSNIASRSSIRQKDEANSDTLNAAVSVPFNFPPTGTHAAANDGSEIDQIANAASQAIRTPVQVDVGAGSSRRSLPLVGSLEVIENPVASMPIPPAENPENNPQPLPESAEPGLAEVIPAVAVQIVNTLPLAGLLPFNLTELESGVRSVLDRVANLDETWVEEASGLEDYLWITAGALVAGGVIQAAWSRRNQRTDRRVLGLDSVLARWGSPYDGRLGG